MKSAVFLGAGASYSFGYPLTSEFLPRIIDRIRRKRLFNGSNTEEKSERDREWFNDRLYQFLPGLADSLKGGRGKLIGIGISDVLTLVDRALLQGEARAGMSPQAMGRFRRLLERAIYEALLRGNKRGAISSHEMLDRFSSWLEGLTGDVGIVTTNYDRAVDLRLFRLIAEKGSPKRYRAIAEQIDFGFNWRHSETGSLVPRPAAPRWQILKLHGSVNWLRCNLCGEIYIDLDETVGPHAFSQELNENNTCHCNDWAKLRLHLVTPSFVRQTNDAQLLGVWQAALERLRTADRWVIIGYSLPAEDVAIRSLMLRAWDGHKNSKKPAIVVVQTDNTVTEQTYRAFFPASNLSYHTAGLKGFLDEQ